MSDRLVRIRELTAFKQVSRFDSGMGKIDHGILWKKVSIASHPMFLLHKGILYARVLKLPNYL